MHSDHYGSYRGILTIAIEHALDPFHLRSIELVRCGIVQIDEINPIPHPVVIGLRLVCFLVILEALFANIRPVKISMKLLNELSSALGWYDFVISDAEIKRCITPDFDLVLDEVVP